MYAERHVVSLTTATGGDATGYTPVVTGRIQTISYIADGSVPFASTVDFTVTLEGTGQGLWTESNVTASKTVAPLQPAHSQVGVALTTASGVSNPVSEPIVCARDRVKVVVAQGGDTKVGAFHIVVA